MKTDDLEQKMRALEYFHTAKVLPDTWIILRVDGHSFSRFTEQRFEKPFDQRFHDLMFQTSSALVEHLNGVYAYTESDEISVLLPPAWDLFSREHEKLVSLSAGIASAAFTLGIGAPAHFDSRVWIGVNPGLVIDYFRWRQADATRCALNGWCYWTLRKNGLTVNQATQSLIGKTVAYKNELLFQNGINFNNLPSWQRRGSGVYWETYNKEGFNPITGETVIARRRKIKLDSDIPMGLDYNRFLQRFLSQSAEIP